MPENISVPPETPSLTELERLELANRLYQEYYTRCFWHCPRDLLITEELLPLVSNGLRKHGGRRGFILAARLQPARSTGYLDAGNTPVTADPDSAGFSALKRHFGSVRGAWPKISPS
jgi:hypothetical protein